MALFKTGTKAEDYWQFHRAPNRSVSSDSLIHLYTPTDAAGIQQVPEWADVIEQAANLLAKVSSGRSGGTLVLHGMYPVGRQVVLPEFVKLYGAWAPAMNSSSSSCGLRASDDFIETDDPLVIWTPSGDEAFYSNFGAGIRNIYIDCRAKCSGVAFQGSQQSSHIDTLIVRGMDHNNEATIADFRYGLKITGDTYKIQSVFIDAQGSGGPSVTSADVVGWHSTDRLVNMSVDTITVHRCEDGARLAGYHNLFVTNYETELTTYPIVNTYDCVASHWLNCGFRHTNYFADIRNAQFQNNNEVYMRGQHNGGTSDMVVRRPDATCVSVGRYPDFILQDVLDSVDVVACP